ncbi:MAG: helix-turn-helix transcriptional regulator, partial [Clostridia bacterium]|nr:helix-turn-helix transcriptional regulator [Clostridia bacterium]
STAALGKALNVNDSTITRWENGVIIPSILHLRNIAIFFDVSADYLIGLVDY